MSGWTQIWVGIISGLVTVFAGGSGFWVWRNGRRDGVIKREELWLTRMEKRIATLESTLKVEKQSREKDRQDSFRVLNAFRLREAAWLSVWHSMTVALLALGGTVEPLPPTLADWPDNLLHLYSTDTGIDESL